MIIIFKRHDYANRKFRYYLLFNAPKPTFRSLPRKARPLKEYEVDRQDTPSNLP